MKIETRQFGTLTVAEDALYRFEDGLYGLEEFREFALIRPDESLPFAYLQATSESRICLLVADPFAFYPEYEFQLPEGDVAALGHPAPDALQIWVTVTAAGESLQDATINLLAPLVLNVKQRLGRQAVLYDNAYGTKTPLFARKEGE